MILRSQTITYSMAATLTLCLLLGAITLPNASRWFQGASASIQQDVIVLLGNATSIKSDTAYVYDEWKYNHNLMPAVNTPLPAESGLQGLLYDRGFSCSSLVNDTLPLPIHGSNWKGDISRIALIQLGGCLFTEKLRYAQNDGASAAIVYPNTIVSNTTVYTHFSWQMDAYVDPDTIFIPTYFVDYVTGLELYARLENLTAWTNTSNSEKGKSMLETKDGSLSSHVVTRVTLYPDLKPFMEPWQFALIVLGVVVMTSVVIVMALQCHQIVRRQQRRRRRRVITGDDDDDDGIASDELYMEDQTGNHESFWLHLWSTATTVTPENDYTHRTQTGDPQDQHSNRVKKKRYRLHPSILESLPTKQWDGNKESSIDQCVICLESFSLNDTLRILPCGHEYHRDCVDKWLTKKNACCPLCFQLAIALPTLPEQAYIRQSQSQQLLQLQQRDPVEQNDEVLRNTWLQATSVGRVSSPHYEQDNHLSAS